MKKWRCIVCEHIHDGENPPEKCPVCASPSDKFVLVEERQEDVERQDLDKLETIETDVIVVGSGGAALTAAITAKNEGLETIILEKADYIGGTSARSGGRYWIPQNKEQEKVGIEDKREDGIKYMARYAYPDLYDSDKGYPS